MSGELELSEIQGLILSGYGERPVASYVLFEITDPERARRRRSTARSARSTHHPAHIRSAMDNC